jgi:hypothetical protein
VNNKKNFKKKEEQKPRFRKHWEGERRETRK